MTKSKIVNRFKERLGTRRGLFIMIFGILSLLILFTVARAQYFVSQVRPGQGAIEQGKPAPLENPTKLATPSDAKEKTDAQPIPQALSASPHAAIEPRAETNKYVPGVCTRSVIPYATRYVYDPSIDEGTTYTSGGYDGVSNTCTKDSNGNEEIFGNYTYPAIEKVITVGTKPKAVYVSRDQCVNGYIATYGWGGNSAAQLLKAHQWCSASGY